jgi:hypothetical protein
LATVVVAACAGGSPGAVVDPPRSARPVPPAGASGRPTPAECREAYELVVLAAGLVAAESEPGGAAAVADLGRALAERRAELPEELSELVDEVETSSRHVVEELHGLAAEMAQGRRPVSRAAFVERVERWEDDLRAWGLDERMETLCPRSG